MTRVKKDTFEQRLERRMKNWKQEQHEKKVFGDPETEEVEWKIVKLEGGGYMRKPFKKKQATVYDGWHWNGHLNKFERWEEHLESMKTKAFKEWYTRGG